MGPTCRQAMLASLVSSASPSPPLMPPVTARLIWQATPRTFGSSNPSTTIRSLGPNHRNLVLPWPLVPRSGRLQIHTAKASTSKIAQAPAIAATLRIDHLIGGSWPVSAGVGRAPTGPLNLHVRLFRRLESIVDLDAQVSHGTFKFHMTEQQRD